MRPPKSIRWIVMGCPHPNSLIAYKDLKNWLLQYGIPKVTDTSNLSWRWITKFSDQEQLVIAALSAKTNASIPLAEAVYAVGKFVLGCRRTIMTQSDEHSVPNMHLLFRWIYGRPSKGDITSASLNALHRKRKPVNTSDDPGGINYTERMSQADRRDCVALYRNGLDRRIFTQAFNAHLEQLPSYVKLRLLEALRACSEEVNSHGWSIVEQCLADSSKTVKYRVRHCYRKPVDGKKIWAWEPPKNKYGADDNWLYASVDLTYATWQMVGPKFYYIDGEFVPPPRGNPPRPTREWIDSLPEQERPKMHPARWRPGGYAKANQQQETEE